MNGFGPPDDKDMCDCTFGNACPYHKQLEKESAAFAAVWYRSQGIDPNASVDGLEDVLLAVELSSSLSEDKKKRLRQIILGP